MTLEDLATLVQEGFKTIEVRLGAQDAELEAVLVDIARLRADQEARDARIDKELSQIRDRLTRVENKLNQ